VAVPFTVLPIVFENSSCLTVSVAGGVVRFFFCFSSFNRYILKVYAVSISILLMTNGFILIFLVVLGLEFRASHLLGRYSTTTQPMTNDVLHILSCACCLYL
jgi:hypothetical protein